jgi:murein DD-endopeptidase / murein LD-carboxypeptidase
MAPAERLQLACLGAIALSLLSAACASSGGTPRPFPLPGSSGAARQPVADTPHTELEPELPLEDLSDMDGLVNTALALRGVPYRNGGSDLEGFDCSGFTQYVFAQHGLYLPREVHDQFKAGRFVKPDDLVPGDLVFFATTSRGPSHVGIAVGGDAFVHAPSSSGVVRVESWSSRYWSRRFVGARRLEGN